MRKSPKCHVCGSIFCNLLDEETDRYICGACALGQRNKLLLLCQDAYDLIAGGHYHNSPLTEKLQSTIREIQCQEGAPDNDQP